MRLFTAFFGLLALTLTAGNAAAREVPPRPIEILTELQYGEEIGDKFGLVGFDRNVRFMVPMSAVADGSPTLEMLVNAIKGNRSITLFVDWRAVSLGPANELLLPVCAMRFRNRLERIPPSCPRDSSPAISPALNAQVEALAWSYLSRYELGLQSLDEVLQSENLSTEWEVRLRRERGKMLQNLAGAVTPYSSEYDRHMFQALREYEQLYALDPTAKTKRKQAFALMELGAYEESRAIYEAMVEEAAPGSGEEFDSRVGLAMVARLQKKPEEALESLNLLFATQPGSAGMKFYYHRGRTLMMLGRLDEAIVNFTAGIENQPEYPYAYVLRGCAYGRLEEHGMAVADFRVARAQLDEFPAKPRDIEDDIERLGKIILRYDDVGNPPSAEESRQMCADLLKNLDRYRTRSPLLQEGS